MPGQRHGLFVTFEGGEGSGKSTQVRLLHERLVVHGREVVVSREPGGTPLGEIARMLSRKPALARRFYGELTGAHLDSIDPLAELFLMSAARAQLVGDIILPTLERGAAVLCDRYDDSTLAYQGYGRGLDLTLLRTVNAIATQSTRPDVTVLIDLAPADGLLRKRGEVGRDAIGGAGIDFHQRVRAGYLALASVEPKRWLVLDGRLSITQLAEAIWQRVASAAGISDQST
ncbi:MAG: dTMP kinase [Dehalococcoidia bacterium]